MSMAKQIEDEQEEKIHKPPRGKATQGSAKHKVKNSTVGKNSEEQPFAEHVPDARLFGLLSDDELRKKIQKDLPAELKMVAIDSPVIMENYHPIRRVLK